MFFDILLIKISRHAKKHQNYIIKNINWGKKVLIKFLIYKRNNKKNYEEMEEIY